VALCQSLPGPASSQLGIAIGTRRAGPLGGVVAWLGFTLPSALILVLFAQLTGSLDLSGVGWVHGLKIAAVAVVAQAVLAMARTLTPDWPRRAMAALAASVALVWTSPYADVALIGAGALLGWALLAPPATRQPAACERARKMPRDRHEMCRGDQGQPSIAAPSRPDGTWARIR